MIGYSSDILARGRALAATRMTEKVRAGRFKLTTDPETGDPVRTLITERYTGPAEVTYPSRVLNDGVPASEQLVTSQGVEVRVPVDAPRLQDADEVEVISSTADTDLVGRIYRVQGLPASGKVTAHRYTVEEQS